MCPMLLLTCESSPSTVPLFEDLGGFFDAVSTMLGTTGWGST